MNTALIPIVPNIIMYIPIDYGFNPVVEFSYTGKWHSV